MTLYFYGCLLMLSIVDLKYMQIGVKDFLILIPPILLHYVKIFIFISQCMGEACEFSLLDLVGYDILAMGLFGICGRVIGKQIGKGDLIFLMMVSPLVGYEKMLGLVMIGLIGAMVFGGLMMLRSYSFKGVAKKNLRTRVAFIPFLAVGIGVIQWL